MIIDTNDIGTRIDKYLTDNTDYIVPLNSLSELFIKGYPCIIEI